MYYRMMSDPWKRSFLNSGQMLTDPNYTLLDLQCYMSFQEDQQQMMQPRRSSGRDPIVARGGLRAPTSTRRRHYPDYQGGPPTQRYRHARNDHAQQYYNYRNQPPQPQQQGPQAYPYRLQGYQPTPRPSPFAAQVSPGTRPPFRAPAQRGFGRGCGWARGSEVYQTSNHPSMPPPVAAPVPPVGAPPEDLHHEQEEREVAPNFAAWVSQDYVPEQDFAQNDDLNYYPAEETEEYDYMEDNQYFGDDNTQW